MPIRDTAGAAAVEYAFIAAAIGVAAIVVINVLGPTVRATFEQHQSAISQLGGLRCRVQAGRALRAVRPAGRALLAGIRAARPRPERRAARPHRAAEARPAGPPTVIRTERSKAPPVVEALRCSVLYSRALASNPRLAFLRKVRSRPGRPCAAAGVEAWHSRKWGRSGLAPALNAMVSAWLRLAAAPADSLRAICPAGVRVSTTMLRRSRRGPIT
jgi:Flp pilus assembly pilin Flp